MSILESTGFIQFDPQTLEYRFTGPQPGEAPTLVLLHEGLGCAGLWGDFPQRLAKATGFGVFAWSRAGYGQSSTIPLPRPLDYMNAEAQQVLPRVLDTIGFRRGFLIGHSDGASIAAIHAGSVRDARVLGVTLIAPHFFTEEKGLVEIAKARVAYETGDLRTRLARRHAHVDAAFRGWNDAWLDPGFRKWNIEEFLPPIQCPVQVIQGIDDQYGTDAQVKVVQAQCRVPVEVAMFPGVQHSPHREVPELLAAKIAGFVTPLTQA
jgi:pimeloyl-ACP methyl ester carboxylesterase